jgi:hypothetical protein
MELGNSRKVTVAILGIISIGLVLGAIYIGILLQQNQAPEDSGAFGFGSGAIKDYFDEVDGFFKTVPCRLILNDGLVNAISHVYNQPLLNFEINTLSDIKAEGALQTICQFTEEDIKKKYTIATPLPSMIELEIRTYNEDSYIYNSEAEKIAFVNSFIFKSVLEQGAFPENKTKYYFGTDLSAPGMCRATIFHDTNEFEYAALTYYGYDCSLATTKYKNKVFAKAISSFVDKSINSIYGANGFNPIDYQSN